MSKVDSLRNSAQPPALRYGTVYQVDAQLLINPERLYTLPMSTILENEPLYPVYDVKEDDTLSCYVNDELLPRKWWQTVKFSARDSESDTQYLDSYETLEKMYAALPRGKYYAYMFVRVWKLYYLSEWRTELYQ